MEQGTYYLSAKLLKCKCTLLVSSLINRIAPVLMRTYKFLRRFEDKEMNGNVKRYDVMPFCSVRNKKKIL